MPPAEQVRDALERIVASDVFARSERARDLLRYLIDQDLAGHADRLKGYSIAVDVFGKDAAQDASQETVVRVQAGRLRTLLEQYYAGPGAEDEIRIAIPRGSYVPDYVDAADLRLAEASEAGAVESPSEAERAVRPPPVRRGPPLAALAAAVLALVVAVGGSLWLLVPRSDTPGETIAEKPPDNVDFADFTGTVQRDLLPSVHADFRASGEAAEIFEAALRRGLAAFDTIYFIDRSAGAPPDLDQGRLSFLFDMVPGPAEGELQLELQHIQTGKVLVSLSMATQGLGRDAIEDMVANLLTSVAPVSGAIYASIAEIGAHTMLTRCLELNERFYRNQSIDAHRAAYDCLLALEAADLNSALVYSELASLEVQTLVSNYGYPPDASLQGALDHARHAVQLSPNGAYAHRSMGYVMSRMGSQEAGLRWTKRAYELNTFDLGMAASYGYALIFNGAYPDGSAILGRAVNAASAHPTWWDYGLFLGLFMTGDMRGAANAAAALASSDRAHYLAVQLIVADHLQRGDEVQRLLVKLQTEHQSFTSDPMAFFNRGDYPEDMAIKLVEALGRAGLGNSG